MNMWLNYAPHLDVDLWQDSVSQSHFLMSCTRDGFHRLTKNTRRERGIDPRPQISEPALRVVCQLTCLAAKSSFQDFFLHILNFIVKKAQLILLQI